MNPVVQFDFRHHDYSIDANALLLPKVKAANIRGKTDDILKELFACKTAPITIDKAYSLAVFTKSLATHVEATIDKRYGIIGLLIILFSKIFGQLGKLNAVSRNFTKTVDAQKEILLQALPKAEKKEIPHLLANLFLVDPKATSGNENVDRRYSQINTAGLFSSSHNIQLAWYLEHNVQTSTHVKKDPANGLPRSLHCDLATGKIFICQKGNKQKPIAITAVKKVTKALMVTPEEAIVIAQSTTLDDLAADMPKATEHDLQKAKRRQEYMLQATLDEYRIAQSFKDKPGIWPMLHASKYIKHKDGKDIEKVALFAPLAAGTFTEIAPTLSFEDLVSTTATLLEGLACIHADDSVHRDVKGANALITPIPNAPSNSGWIDFGLAGKQKDERIINSFKSGFYGTLKFTAPEFFGVKELYFDFVKAELWAFGLMTYRAYFKKDPDWFRFFKSLPKNLQGITHTQKEAYKKAIRDEIEPPLAKLMQKESLTKQERFEVLIYRLLQLNPEARPTAQKALNELRLHFHVPKVKMHVF